MGAGHIGLGPGLIDEDEAGGIKLALVLFPLRPPSCDVVAILFAGVQAFFEADAFVLNTKWCNANNVEGEAIL
jgi:hypothetical protein